MLTLNRVIVASVLVFIPALTPSGSIEPLSGKGLLRIFLGYLRINEVIGDAFAACAFDGTHDVAPCIQSAIDAEGSRGGGTVHIPSGRWPVASTIHLQANGVFLDGEGHGGGQSPATTLLWIGGPGGTMVQIGNDIDTGSVSRTGIHGIFLDCNQPDSARGQARRGLYEVNTWFTDVDVFVKEPSAYGRLQPVAVEIDGGNNLGRLSLGWSLQAALLPEKAAILPINTYTTNLSYPTGLWIHGGTKSGYTSKNASFTSFPLINATNTTGVPIQVDWSDHLEFGLIDLNVGTSPNPKLLGPGMVFNNATRSGGAGAPGGHTVGSYQAAAPILVRGSGAGIVAPQGLRFRIQLQNGVPRPLIGTGAEVSWEGDDGAVYRFQSGDPVTITNNASYSQLLAEGVRTGNGGAPLLVGSQGSNSLAQWYGPDGPAGGYWWQRMDKVGEHAYDLVFQNVGFGKAFVAAPAFRAETFVMQKSGSKLTLGVGTNNSLDLNGSAIVNVHDIKVSSGTNAITLSPSADGTLVFSGAVRIQGTTQLANYKFARLPGVGEAGREVFCSDCLKPGERHGAGTGMVLFDDGHSRWVSNAGGVASD